MPKVRLEEMINTAPVTTVPKKARTDSDYEMTKNRKITTTTTTAAAAAAADSSMTNLKFLIPALAAVLNQLVQTNDAMYPFRREHATVFDSDRVSSISIQGYLERIGMYARCSPECFIVALCYMDSMVQSNVGFHITSHNIHRLLITSIMLAAKFLDDKHNNNAYYALIGGVSTKELNALEVTFLSRINFKLNVCTDVYDKYKELIFEWIKQQQAEAQQQLMRQLQLEQEAETPNSPTSPQQQQRHAQCPFKQFNAQQQQQQQQHHHHYHHQASPQQAHYQQTPESPENNHYQQYYQQQQYKQRQQHYIHHHYHHHQVPSTPDHSIYHYHRQQYQQPVYHHHQHHHYSSQGFTTRYYK